MWIALVTSPLQLVAKSELNDELKQTVEANTLHCIEEKNWQMPIVLHRKVEEEIHVWKGYNQGELVKIDTKVDAYCDMVFGTLILFESIWDGNLGCISAA